MTNHQGLKSRNLITFPLDIPEVEVISVEINERGDYIVAVESMRNDAVCQSCGGRITKPNGYGREIELPVMIGLVNVAFWLQKRWYPQAASAPAMIAAAQEICPPDEQLVK